MGGSTNKFSAAGPALGYIVQLEYALLLMLRRMDTEIELAVSLETAEDIVFEDPTSGTPLELWQTKHHATSAGSLGDASTDLWKTLHNWLEVVGSEEPTAHFLLSTNTAPPESAARLLCADFADRDPKRAEVLLEKVATAAGNAGHSKYYEAFLDAPKAVRLSLLTSVFVIDGASHASDMTSALASALRKSAPPQRRGELLERLRGWWLQRGVSHLTAIANGLEDRILMEEVEGRIHKINQSIRDDTLPLDFEDWKEPSEAEVSTDERVFVDQLRLIAWHSERIHQAIYDHNRAFLERSSWERRNLVDPEELARYDRRLIGEWRRHFLPTTETDAPSDEDAKRALARDLLWRLETSQLPELRAALRSSYVPNGSLHMLADRMTIGWHPDWLDHLRHRLEEVGGPGIQEGVA
ncbi:MAG: hypothetical protein JWO59_1265 [Chloroflexi bacterium]|jgi:hypothetical protein|nr:hypothetical protein [Chloroflexota bacterium]